MFTITAYGHERTIEILDVGRILGDSSFLSNLRSSVNIEAVIPSEIIRYSADELVSMCTKSEALMRLVFQHMTETCNYLTGKLVQVNYYDAAQKVAAFLLNESANRHQTTLPYTHEELAPRWASTA